MIRLNGMNDTILNKRQKNILVLLKNSGGLSRSQLNDQLSLKRPVSRITLIRDLNLLIDKEYIVQKGKGPATNYHLVQQNPLLQHIDIEDYFQEEPWDRNAQKTFNKKIFKDLRNLFTDGEKERINSKAKHFNDRIEDLDPTIYQRELERLVIEFSWKSSQIEGNTYDLLETETLIKQKIEAKGHTKEEANMILNHKDAFSSIIDHSDTFQELSFSDVMELHSTLIKNLNISTGIRVQPVGISGTEYKPLSDQVTLKETLNKTIQTINASDFGPEKALIASCMISYIQPFSDGNKRTARNLANALLLAHDYFPLSYRKVEVDEYKRAMILFYEQNNLYHLKRIFIEQLGFSVENYFITT